MVKAKSKQDTAAQSAAADGAVASRAPRMAIAVAAALVLGLAVAFQLLISASAHHDPRSAALRAAFVQLNITSTAVAAPGSPPRLVPAFENVGFVPMTQAHAAAGRRVALAHPDADKVPLTSVLGVKRSFRAGEVILRIPHGAYVDPAALVKDDQHIYKALFDLPAMQLLKQKRESVPPPLLALTLWALAERRRGAASRFRGWLEMIDASFDAAAGGAIHWPTDLGARNGGEGCVSLDWTREFNETHLQLVPRCVAHLEMLCADADIERDFAGERALLCQHMDPAQRGVLEQEIRAALDLAIRRGIQQQALIPTLDFMEPANAADVNCGPRTSIDDGKRVAVTLVAGKDIAKGEPLRFQMYRGRSEALMLTGIDDPALYFEFNIMHNNPRLMEDPLTRKLCVEQSQNLVLSDIGAPTTAVMECMAALAANKKQKKAMLKDPKNAPSRILRDPKLQLDVCGALMHAGDDMASRLRTGEAYAAQCPEFERIRNDRIAILGKAGKYFEEAMTVLRERMQK